MFRSEQPSPPMWQVSFQDSASSTVGSTDVFRRMILSGDVSEHPGFTGY